MGVALVAASVLGGRAPVGAQDPEPGGSTGPDRAAEPVVVAVKAAEPFVFADGEELSGYSIDLWELLAAEADLEYRYEVVDTVDDQLGAVETGGADAAIAAISVTPDRERVIDFTHPIYVGGQQVLISTDRDFGPSGVLAHVVGSGLLWMFLGLVVLTVAMGIVLWLLERRHNPHFGGETSRGALDGIWWSVVTLTTVGYGDKVPTSTSGRVLSMVWILLSVVFLAVFTASVTTTLTIEELGNSIEDVDDLYGKEVVTVEGTTSEEVLLDLHIDYEVVADLEAGAILVETGAVDAMVYDAPQLQYYAATEGRGQVETVGDVFNDEPYAIALPQGSSLREPLDRALAQAGADGDIAALTTRWFDNGG